MPEDDMPMKVHNNDIEHTASNVGPTLRSALLQLEPVVCSAEHRDIFKNSLTIQG